MKTLKVLPKAMVLMTSLILLANCSKEPTGSVSGSKAKASPTGAAMETPATPSMAAEGKKYKQIERLGRPAINEGLVITNDFLNAFNSIPPTLDLSQAAQPVVAEAAGVLTAVYNYGRANGLPSPAVADVAAGFLPDVMRIDTSKAIAIGQWAYNGDFTIIQGTSAGAILTGGRKIEDDVMDITLSYLIAGNPVCGPTQACAIKEGTTYEGHGTVGNPGHKMLVGQTARNGSARFPYLATPN